MSSLARVAASRANGRLSRGPKTAAGKARSAHNNTRHGLLSREAPTPEPSDPLFHELLTAHRDRFPAADPVILHTMALCQWRLRQAWTMEKEWLDELIAADPSPNPTARIANAFGTLADTNKYSLLLRFEGRQHRIYNRLLQSLLHPHKLKNDDSNLNLRQPAPSPQIKNDDSNLDFPGPRPSPCRHRTLRPPSEPQKLNERTQFRPATHAATHRSRRVPWN